MQRKIRFSTLVELMALTPIFAFGIYVAIYFGESMLTKINGAIAIRYVADSPDTVTVDTLKNNFVTERGQNADLSKHYWVGNDSLKITQQDKGQGLWPISESGAPTNVIHEYLIEFGFDVNVGYELVGNTLQRKVNFTHQDGGLDLMRYLLYAQADDVIQKLLQERITYSSSKVDYDYVNDSPVPRSFNDSSAASNKKTDKISFASDSRSLILLNNVVSRNFYKEMKSVDRLTSAEYDSKNSSESRLSDARVSDGSYLVSDGGGNSLNVDGGGANINWNSGAKLVTVRDAYPIKGKLTAKLNIDIDQEGKIVIEEMENAYLDIKQDEDAMVITKDSYTGLGL